LAVSFFANDDKCKCLPTISMRIHQPQLPSHQFAVCIPPLFGNVRCVSVYCLFKRSLGGCCVRKMPLTNDRRVRKKILTNDWCMRLTSGQCSWTDSHKLQTHGKSARCTCTLISSIGFLVECKSKLNFKLKSKTLDRLSFFICSETAQRQGNCTHHVSLAELLRLAWWLSELLSFSLSTSSQT